MGKQGKTILATCGTILFVVTVFVFAGGVAHAAPQYDTTCSTCHSMPPLDTSTADTVKRNPDTGAIQGNHQKHVQGTTASSCLPCHDTTGYTTSHREGVVNLRANINNSPYPTTGGQYVINSAAVTFKNQTSVPVLGSCSNVNCHFERTTPAWGTQNLGVRSVAVCSTCHDAAPTTNAHNKHTAFLATKYSVAAEDTCNNCHITNYADASHALEIGRAIRITLATGKYSTAMKTSYLPSQQAARVEGDCSNLYCHSNGKGAYVKPNWGNPSSGACGTCHTTSGIATGSHTKHLTTTVATAYGCDKCHSGAAANGSSYISANHVNNAIDYIACSNQYCHSDGTKPAGPFTAKITPAWGTPFTATCESCHGGATGVNQIASGKHTKHLAAGYGCATCHTATVSSNTTISTPANHVDQKINVNIDANYGGTYSANMHAPGAASGSCSTNYCHSNGQATPIYKTPAWSDAALDCSGCHISSGLSAAHTAHLTAGKHCTDCHIETVSSDTALLAGTTKHINKTRDVKMAGTSTYTSTDQSCTTSCHMTATPKWNVASSGQCGTCHNVSKTTLVTGSHAKHLNTAVATPYACASCHTGVVYDGTTATSYVSANHYNNVNDYIACSTQYCHSDGTKAAAPFTAKATPTWGTPFTSTCASCHGDITAGATQIATGKHTKHIAAGFGCADCHAQTVSNNTTIGTPANHVDQKINVNFAAKWSGSYTADLHAPGAPSGSCTTYCHSNGQATPTTVPVAWTAAALNCASCHGNGTSGLALTAAHARHITTFNIGCVTCHNATVSDNTTISSTANHVNGTRNVSMTGATYNSTDQGCSSVTCHGSGAPKWNNLATGACGTCHLATTATAGGLINQGAHSAHFTAVYGPGFTANNDSKCATCHTGYSETAATHANGTKNTDTASCSTCHPGVTNFTIWTAGTVSCESCHTGTASVINVGGINMTAALKSSFTTSGHGMLAAGKQGKNCLDCHERNAAHLSNATGDNNRLQTKFGTALAATDNQACTVCHNDSAVVGSSALNLNGHIGSGAGCRACHDPHGSGSNIHMIKSTINGTAITYSSTADLVNALNNGLCQVCHTTTKHYRNGVAETDHYVGSTNCLSCHTHKATIAFSPSSCDSCHGYPPVPRNVNFVAKGITLNRLNNYSAAKFEDYSGGGGAHVVAAHVDPKASPSQGFANCTNCHADGAAAHVGSGTPKSNIGNVSVKLTQKKQLRSGVLSIYTSAKFVAPPNNQTGTCYNVSCHFRKTDKWSTEK